MTSFRKLMLSAVVVCSFLAVFPGINESGPSTKAVLGITTARAQSEATLSGVITYTLGDQQTGPIPDAIVRLYSADRVLQTKTDKNGLFRFANVAPATYQIEAAHPEFKTRKFESIQVTNNPEPLAITLTVANMDCVSETSISYVDGIAGRSLVGIALDSKQPLANVIVDLVSPSGGAALASRRSNSKGEFEFANLQPGQYLLKAHRPGYHDELTETFWVVRESGTRVVVGMLRQGLMRVCQ
jgi:carboxypeptidase family protein